MVSWTAKVVGDVVGSGWYAWEECLEVGVAVVAGDFVEEAEDGNVASYG